MRNLNSATRYCAATSRSTARPLESRGSTFVLECIEGITATPKFSPVLAPVSASENDGIVKAQKVQQV